MRMVLKFCIPLLAGILVSGCDDGISNNQAGKGDISQVDAGKSAGEEPVSVEPSQNARYVGMNQCLNCHKEETEEWKGSHHDLAMQPANDDTVLGDFNNASHNYYGTESVFFKKDGNFYVKTDGPDGKLTEYPIAYTFGVYPLQQYLIEFPGGKYQALNVVWDSRTKSEGGQRWFHLYPDEHIKYDDELHWTGINQNWNYMCADCHSTDLHKNYDVQNKIYNTKWSEIDVSCEACHGPAFSHVAWAKHPDINVANKIDNKGLLVNFNERKNISWKIDPKTGNASRSEKRATTKEIDTCAACHSRRVTSYPGAHPGVQLTDYFNINLLTDPLYHADGQVNGEVYVYGSFVQSKMYHAGVTCTDCHNPHSLKLRAKGNELCAQCHLPDIYNNQQHHLHAKNSVGSLCINCHMPEKKFMVIDGRRDHSFRIPRPDLSSEYGVPNACNSCHKEKSNKWAAQVLRDHFGEPGGVHYVKAIAAGRKGSVKAEQLLINLIMDETQPEIARATAVTLLPGFLTGESAPVLQMVAQSEDPLMCLALASVVDEIPENYRPAFAVPLLYDESRVTRGLAAYSLVGLPLDQFPKEVHQKYEEAINDYIESNMFDAERPESLTNIGNYYLKRDMMERASEKYEEAIDLASYYTPAYINLSDLYRLHGDEKAAQNLLISALPKVNDKAVIQYALGLSYVRSKMMEPALDYLRLAAMDESATPGYVYVYAVALHSSGRSKQAIDVLEGALTRFENNQQILSALVSINHDIGNDERAGYYRKKLAM